jgi:hypothetical protein
MTSLSPTPAGAPSAPPAPATDEALVCDVVEEFLAAARDGVALNRTGRIYRPSALRDIAGILRRHVVPELGGLRLIDVLPEDIQRLVDDLAARGLSLSRIRSVVSAIRALFGYARERGRITVSPADTVEVGPREPEPWEDDDALDDLGEPLEPETTTATWAWEDQPTTPLSPPGTDDAADPDPGADDALAPAHGRPLPEVVVGLVLRLVVVVFLIITLASLAQALLTPA